MGPETGIFTYLYIIFAIAISIFIIRVIGAWMFRINDVIQVLNTINDRLKRIEEQMRDDKEEKNKGTERII